MIQLSLEEITLELKFTWKIARNASDFKKNFIFHISDAQHSVVGEIAPNIRYGENTELITQQFNMLVKHKLSTITTIEELNQLFQKIKTCNSLRFGIESAFVHYWCKKQGKSIFNFLEINKPKNIYTAFTMPIMPLEEMCDFYIKHKLHRFKTLKIKINENNACEAIQEIVKVAKQPLMIDGNEAFTNVDNVLKYIEFLKPYHPLFLEQPLPSQMTEEYIYLKKHSPILLMGDESVTDNPNMDLIAKQFHGVNMKLQKAGGYINGLRIINEARKRNLKTMIGCMVETSIGIGSALNLCNGVDFVDLDGFLILKKEPFGLIKEENGEITTNEI